MRVIFYIAELKMEATKLISKMQGFNQSLIYVHKFFINKNGELNHFTIPVGWLVFECYLKNSFATDSEGRATN